MTMTADRENKLEELFNALLSNSLNFTEKEKEEVKNEYIIHGEYGFALSTYAGICIENEKIPLSVRCKPLIDELINLLKNSPFVKNSESLKKLVYK